MNAASFQDLVLNHFPSLREGFEEWKGLVHIQPSEFKDFTQDAIEKRSFEVVSECLRIATSALVEGDHDLRNAIFASYLEKFDSCSDAGKRAVQLMPSELKKCRDDILEYVER